MSIIMSLRKFENKTLYSSPKHRTDVPSMSLGTQHRKTAASPPPPAFSHSVSISSVISKESETNKEGKNRPAVAATRKRDRDDEPSRAALKCQREKKRRYDMNKGFDDLVSTLTKIDGNIKADATLQDPSVLSSTLPLNRVEVISRTAVVLDKINKENEDRKVQIAELNAKLEAATNERNQVIALLASKSRTSALPGLQVCQQGTVSSMLQALAQPAIPPAMSLAQVLLLQMAAPAQSSIMQLTAPPLGADSAGSGSGIQKALAGLFSRHYNL